MNETSSSSAANGAVAAPAALRTPVPDSEVARPRRRCFFAGQERSVIAQADAAQDSRTAGALLTREGLYASHLTT